MLTRIKAYNRIWYKKNKKYILLKGKLWRKNNKLRHLGNCLNRYYKLSLWDYFSLRIKQNYKCAICLIQTKLAVDHNHKTNNVRGLLCKKCNTGLHYLENIKWNKGAQLYLCGKN